MVILHKHVHKKHLFKQIAILVKKKTAIYYRLTVVSCLLVL